MSVHTENDVSIECIQFIDPENRRTSLNELDRRKSDTSHSSNDQECRQKVEKNMSSVAKKCNCFKKYSKFFQRIKRFCTWKIPWIAFLISVAQIVVFFVACNDSTALLTFNPKKKHELWRFFTYHTVHYSFTHLLLNVILQILIAVPLETEQGHFRVLLVYFIGVGFGAFGSMLFDKANQTIIGSSAGVYCLLFSHLSQCYLNWTTISYRNFRLMSVLMLFTGDFLYSTLRHHYWRGTEPKISFSAHICGGIAGILSSLIVFKKHSSDRLSMYELTVNI